MPNEQKTRTEAVEREVKSLIVNALGRTDLVAEEIDSDIAMFQDGLGLDSMDMLELERAISDRFEIDFEVRDDDIRTVYASVRALTQHLDACGVSVD